MSKTIFFVGNFVGNYLLYETLIPKYQIVDDAIGVTPSPPTNRKKPLISGAFFVIRLPNFHRLGCLPIFNHRLTGHRPHQPSHVAQREEVQGAQGYGNLKVMVRNSHTDRATVPDTRGGGGADYAAVVLEDGAAANETDAGDNALQYAALFARGVDDGSTNEHETTATSGKVLRPILGPCSSRSKPMGNASR